MRSSIAGQKQTSYQIIVTRERDKNIVWDSKKVDNGSSDNIIYSGAPLDPETGYSWMLTVWDSKGKKLTGSSRFETGLMDPDIRAWNGARWIGSNILTLDATTAFLYEIRTSFQIKPGSKAASLIFGANDFRLIDSFQNIESVAGENYVRLELDISGTGSEAGTIINIYRVGYAKGDSETVPYKVISTATIPETNLNKLITEENKHAVHSMSIYVDAGNITLQINGTNVQATTQVAAPPRPAGSGQTGGPPRFRTSALTISNYATGGNYNTFPNLSGFCRKSGR
jgi:alpha-L-rhamnosidase